MNLALKEAKKAETIGEIPVGCVIVDGEGNVIARAHNLKEKKQNVTAHAEILAIQKAEKKLANWRLEKCTLYVTLEPCLMCTGAIIQSRVEEVVIGVLRDTKQEPTMTDLPDYIFESGISIHKNILDSKIKKTLSKFLVKSDSIFIDFLLCKKPSM